MIDPLNDKFPALELAGPWCTVYVDASTGTVDTLEAKDVRPGNVSAALEAAGASPEDVAAASAAATSPAGRPAPVSRFFLVRNGRVELDQVLEGELAATQVIEVGAIPNLVPLLKHRASGMPYVFAEVSRSTASVQFHPGGGGAVVTQEFEGSDDTLTKVPGGGWSQGKYQHRTEEVWRQNTRPVAEAIDDLVRREQPGVVVLAGDVRACGMVEEELSKASKDLVVTIPSHTFTQGADEEHTEDLVEATVAESEALEVQDMVDHLTEQAGKGNAAVGLDDAVAALQQGQVDTLVLDETAVAGKQLLALDSAPWVAAGPDDAGGAGILGAVEAPAALVRAALLTDAKVVFLPRAILPGAMEVAALLRWTTAPAQ